MIGMYFRSKWKSFRSPELSPSVSRSSGQNTVINVKQTIRNEKVLYCTKLERQRRDVAWMHCRHPSRRMQPGVFRKWTWGDMARGGTSWNVRIDLIRSFLLFLFCQLIHGASIAEWCNEVGRDLLANPDPACNNVNYCQTLPGTWDKATIGGTIRMFWFLFSITRYEKQSTPRILRSAFVCSIWFCWGDMVYMRLLPRGSLLLPDPPRSPATTLTSSIDNNHVRWATSKQMISESLSSFMQF